MSNEPRSLGPAVDADEEQLRDAIQGAYAAFRRYRLHDRIEGCPCCVSETAEQELRAKPLAEIDGETFGYYVWKAMTTWGNVNDFKHFLPRILELLAGDPESAAGIDAEIAIGKLAYASWNSWPDEEQAAVIRFLHAWWRRELHFTLDGSAADSCLCAIGQAIDDLSPFLGFWRADGALSAQQNLARFIDWNWERILKKGELTNAFWSERRIQMQTVIGWLLEPQAKESLEKAFFQATNPQQLEELSRAVQEWEWLRKSPVA